MCNSCGVSLSTVSGLLRRARSPVARSSRSARSAKPSAPIAGSDQIGDDAPHQRRRMALEQLIAT